MRGRSAATHGARDARGQRATVPHFLYDASQKSVTVFSGHLAALRFEHCSLRPYSATESMSPEETTRRDAMYGRKLPVTIARSAAYYRWRTHVRTFPERLGCWSE